jgi:hypothetical protein
LLKNQTQMIDARRKIMVKDSKGTPILPGVKVAYNRSGDVVTGIVEKVTPSQITITRDEGFNYGGSRTSRVKRGQSCLVLGDPESQELAAAYAVGVESLKESLRDDLVYRKAQLEAEYKKRESKLANAYTAFLDDLKNAWDVDEMKMLAEHHFGDVIE